MHPKPTQTFTAVAGVGIIVIYHQCITVIDCIAHVLLRCVVLGYVDMTIDEYVCTHIVVGAERHFSSVTVITSRGRIDQKASVVVRVRVS